MTYHSLLRLLLDLAEAEGRPAIVSPMLSVHIGDKHCTFHAAVCFYFHRFNMYVIVECGSEFSESNRIESTNFIFRKQHFNTLVVRVYVQTTV